MTKSRASRGRRRLDQRLLEEGQASSRSEARGLILSGVVLVDDVPVDKVGTLISDTASIRLRGDRRRFVSRGGDKLAGALEDLSLEVSELVCLDVGASTGGFTDCLLGAGARSVVAVDVGYGQLHSRIRNDPRVEVFERVNARYLTGEEVPRDIQFLVADVSFISLRLLIPAFLRVAPRADWLLLVKPQFEVGRGQVGKGGVVREDSLREAAVASVLEVAADSDRVLRGRADSRLQGPRGNREIFILLSPESSSSQHVGGPVVT